MWYLSVYRQNIEVGRLKHNLLMVNTCKNRILSVFNIDTQCMKSGRFEAKNLRQTFKCMVYDQVIIFTSPTTFHTKQPFFTRSASGG